MAETQSNKRKRGTETISRPRKQPRTDSEDVEITDSRDNSDAENSSRPNKHSKKERKHNRSTRIHSLRKLLSRDKLPSTVRQEKERELNALLHEQNKVKAKKQDRKTLEKYHYVRFIERSKAEKRLKQLRKQDADDPDVAAQIHEMEVNRNYAIYAPLAQKYISIFAPGKDEVEKPEMWHRVEEAMAKGESALMTLREGTSNPVSRVESTRGSKSDAVRSKVPQESNGSGPPSGTAPVEGSDDNMSDGGFFER